jgi:outer membrane protein assembly factor BamB
MILIRKGLAFGIFLLFLVSIVPFIQGEPNDVTNEFIVQEDSYRYMTDWSMHLTNQTTNEENNRFSNYVESRDTELILMNGSMSSPWPMQSHDSLHTGRSLFSTMTNQGAEIWRVRGDFPGEVYSSAIVDENNIIYFGTISGDSALYALYPNGTLKWRYQANGLVWSTAGIADDGTIYLPSWGSHLFALYPNGQLKWDFGAQDPITSSVTIAVDGTIYIGTMAGNLFAINPTGTEQWHLYLGGNLISSPAIGYDNIIYIGTTSNHFYAINQNGTIQWQFSSNQFKGNPSIAQDGTIYAPCFNGYLYAFYPNGTVKWQASTGGSIAGAGVAIAQDGTIYVGTERLRAFYPNGTLKWSTDLNGGIYGTVPAISSDGTIYVSAGGSLVAVNPDGTERWRKQLTTAQIHSSPCIGEDGRVYVGSQTYETLPYGYLHAFGLGLLNAEAGGPYSGLASHTPVQFSGLAFGGCPPYTYQWDFGDGNTSSEQNPSHLYRNVGTYNVTFAITDDESNVSTDMTTATIAYGPPTVWYIKPEQALYIANIRICKFPSTLIIGKITVQVDATHPLLGINRIEFYLDFELQSVDTTPPYTWTWTERYPLRAEHTHRIIIKAFTTEGTTASLGRQVSKFF